MRIDYILKSLKKWKDKAMERRLDNKALKKRIQELTESRDMWRKRALEKESTKNSVEDNSKKKVDKAINYQYNLTQISMSIELKISSSIKFRGISKVFEIMEKYLGVFGLIPSHSSTILWMKKVGLYQLKNCREIANDWILIMDESIQIGKEKLLVILGIRESEVDWSRALNYTDMKPLLIKSSESWSGDEISEEIELLKPDLGTAKYIVCDNASNLNNAKTKSCIEKIPDISHKIASILKAIYEKDSIFQECLKKVSEAKNLLQQSDLSYLTPPGRRSKSQYMNLYEIILWGRRILKYIRKKHDKEQKELLKLKLGFVKDYKYLIEEIYEITQVVKQIQKEVKTKGLNQKTIRKSKSLLKSLKTENGKKLGKELNKYFKDCFSAFDEKQNLICTSDIIESIFGKYKNFSSENKMAGITSLALCVASVTVGNLSDILKKVLESVKTTDVLQWTEDNIGESVLAKRKQAFKLC